jgi:hypothetical protein
MRIQWYWYEICPKCHKLQQWSQIQERYQGISGLKFKRWRLLCTAHMPYMQKRCKNLLCDRKYNTCLTFLSTLRNLWNITMWLLFCFCVFTDMLLLHHWQNDMYSSVNCHSLLNGLAPDFNLEGTQSKFKPNTNLYCPTY